MWPATECFYTEHQSNVNPQHVSSVYCQDFALQTTQLIATTETFFNLNQSVFVAFGSAQIRLGMHTPQNCEHDSALF